MRGILGGMAKEYPVELQAVRRKLLAVRREWMNLKKRLGYCLADSCTEKHPSGWCATHKSMRGKPKRSPCLDQASD